MKHLPTIFKITTLLIFVIPTAIFLISPGSCLYNISKTTLLVALEIIAGLTITVITINQKAIIDRLKKKMTRFVLICLSGILGLLIGFAFFSSNFVSNTSTGDRVLLPLGCNNSTFCDAKRIAKSQGKEIGVYLGADMLVDMIKEKCANEALLSEIIYDAFAVSSFTSLIFLITVLAFFFQHKYPNVSLQKLIKQSLQSNFKTYIETSKKKQEIGNPVKIKFHIFLSYASAQKDKAEEIYHSLINNGHMVFFDRASIPPAAEYNSAIYTAIQFSDIMIFLVSPESVKPGRYTLSELIYAQDRWPAAKDNLVAVMVIPTPYETIPPYAKSISIFEPIGNLTAELTIKIEKLYMKKFTP